MSSVRIIHSILLILKLFFYVKLNIYSFAFYLDLNQVVYNDNPSLMVHSGYGFNPEMAFGQYSPVPTPLPSVMLDGQLYSPQQIPLSPSFYPQPPASSVPSSVPLSPPELMTSENSSDSLLFGPGSGYLLHFGSFGGGNLSGTPGSSSLTSPAAYPQPMGILGPYEHHVGQVSFYLTKLLLFCEDLAFPRWKPTKANVIVVIIINISSCLYHHLCLHCHHIHHS